MERLRERGLSAPAASATQTVQGHDKRAGEHRLYSEEGRVCCCRRQVRLSEGIGVSSERSPAETDSTADQKRNGWLVM